MVRLILKWQAVVLLGVILLLSMSACRSEPLKPEEPQVLILSPDMDEKTSGGEVEIQLFVKNFNLVDGTGQGNIPGEGHVVYYLDVHPPLIAGKSALTDPGSYVESTEKSYTWTGLDSGKHSFWVQLVNNDNTVLQAPAAVWVDVTAK